MAECEKCGAQLTPDSAICPVCAAPVSQEQEKDPPVKPPPQQYQPQYQQSPLAAPPPPQYNRQYQQPQYAPPPQYRQPQYTPPQYQKQWPPMTLGNWICTFLLLLIPFANIVLIFVWAFGSDVNPSKKTYFQAMLIMMLIGIALSIVFGIIIGIWLVNYGTFYLSELVNLF